MLCKIADLLVEIPATGGLALRCKDYQWVSEPNEYDAVMVLDEKDYERDLWAGYSDDIMAYMESGYLFGKYLVRYSGLRLHASAVAWNGRAYLFSAACGTGKSTHRKMWQQLYGENAAVVFNDDKPALRLIDGAWYAYGTPWSGKEGINRNVKVPLAGICFLQQGPENRIRRLSPIEVIPKAIDQIPWRVDAREDMEMLLENLDKLIQKIPVFLLECTPTVEAAKLSSETMSKAADAAGL